MTATISGDGTSTLINLTTSGNTVLGDASTDTLNVGNGGLVKDASGNVGIGTSSPTEKLDVLGNLRLGASAYLKIGTGFSSYIQGTTNTLTFGTNSSDRVTIDSSGDLQYGRTGGTAAGVTIFGQTSTAGYGRINFYKTLSGTSTACEFNHNGSGVGSIQYTNTATSYNTSSDYRLKHDIQPMTGALEKVAALKPVTYKWNADDSQSQGFIAHELQAVVPDAVTGQKDALDADGNPVYQGIDTSFLVATLTAAIQEQQAIITQLQADVEALKAQP